MIRIVVDRIEGDFAVMEMPDETVRDVKLDEIPFDVVEGDCLIADFDEKGTLYVIQKVRSRTVRRLPIKLIRF